eukprot:scaffold21905_cov31-Tisochrysis_lutea.AAC.1
MNTINHHKRKIRSARAVELIGSMLGLSAFRGVERLIHPGSIQCTTSSKTSDCSQGLTLAPPPPPHSQRVPRPPPPPPPPGSQPQWALPRWSLRAHWACRSLPRQYPVVPTQNRPPAPTRELAREPAP